MPRWLKEMKESRAKFFVVVFLSSFDVTFPESIQINRIISQPKDQQTWKKVSDLFVVPSSTCYQGRIGTGGNYCNKSCTKDDSKEQYSCNCSHKSATVTYMNNTWVCLEDKMVRNKLGEFDKYWGLRIDVTQPLWQADTRHLSVTYSSRFNILRDRHRSNTFGLQFAVYETFDWALSFSGVLRDKLK